MLAPASLHGPFIISSGSHSKQNKALLFFCLETSLNHPDQQCPSCSCARGRLGDPLGPWASGRGLCGQRLRGLYLGSGFREQGSWVSITL